MIIKKYKNNVNNPKTFGKTYGRAMVLGTISLDTLAERIQQNCSMKKSDVMAVLTEMQEVVAGALQEGYRIDLGPMGALKPAISSSGEVNEEDWAVDKNVKRVYVQYQPKKIKDFYGHYTYPILKGVRLQVMSPERNTGDQGAQEDEGFNDYGGGGNSGGSGDGIGEDRP